MKTYVLLFGLFWLGAITVKAADYYIVPTNPASADPYTSWDIAGTNIIDVVNVAVANSGTRTVWVTNGAYLVTNEIMVTNSITVRSFSGDYSNTLVSADFPSYTTRVFSVANAGIVDGFTISNGHWFESNGNYGVGGGGAYIANALVRNCYFVNNISSNSSPTVGGGGAYVGSGGIISNCIVYANTARQNALGGNYIGGGGIYLYYGTALKCTVVSNTAAGIYGGGICCLYGTISNCTIIYNSGGQNLLNGGLCIDSVISNNPSGGFNLQGGTIRNCIIVDHPAGCGVYVYYAGTISNCVIAGNRSTSCGAGIYDTDYGGILNIGSCSISNNICTGGNGGGGMSVSANAKVINCLIANNTNSSSSGCGGGVLLTNTGSTFGLFSCTIVGNYSTTEGGGIAAGGNNYIANCIIAGNGSSAGIYPDVYNTGANSNNYWYCCANPTSAPLAPNQRNITNDPLFVDVNSGNYRLARGSPCINAGTNQGWMTSDSLDLAGNLRLRFGRVDIGAYEWYPRIKVNGVLYEKIKFINGTEPCQINGY